MRFASEIKCERVPAKGRRRSRSSVLIGCGQDSIMVGHFSFGSLRAHGTASWLWTRLRLGEMARWSLKGVQSNERV